MFNLFHVWPLKRSQLYFFKIVFRLCYLGAHAACPLGVCMSKLDPYSTPHLRQKYRFEVFLFKLGMNDLRNKIFFSLSIRIWHAVNNCSCHWAILPYYPFIFRHLTPHRTCPKIWTSSFEYRINPAYSDTLTLYFTRSKFEQVLSTTCSSVCNCWMKNSVVMHHQTFKTPARTGPEIALRKHAYSNILKILLPKNENFQLKISDIFHISAQNIDCGYSLEPPRRGGSNEYPQSMF